MIDRLIGRAPACSAGCWLLTEGHQSGSHGNGVRSFQRAAGEAALRPAFSQRRLGVLLSVLLPAPSLLQPELVVPTPAAPCGGGLAARSGCQICRQSVQELNLVSVTTTPLPPLQYCPLWQPGDHDCDNRHGDESATNFAFHTPPKWLFWAPPTHRTHVDVVKPSLLGELSGRYSPSRWSMWTCRRSSLECVCVVVEMAGLTCVL